MCVMCRNTDPAPQVDRVYWRPLAFARAEVTRFHCRSDRPRQNRWIEFAILCIVGE